ncbi:AmmeMemoRadiSam system protein B [Candidatus Bathyarchaeota archaeon]|nr:MAG: AmmeMemoRadiSam system protein B [Candidatus Bathyarchaeota archaeon]
MRRPIFAGSFYPRDPGELRREIENCFLHRFGPGKLPGEPSAERRTISLVCPHAGYLYSGPVASHAYYRLGQEAAPEVVVILGPNHTGLGSPVSLMAKGEWVTPLGRVEIDEVLAKEVFRASNIIDVDEVAHMNEHSIEVQLPFLQYIYGSGFKLVPICMGFQDLETSREVGRALGTVLRGKNAVLIASSDLSHYVPQRVAEEKDKMVIDAVLSLDEEVLQSRVRSHGISACGYGPISAVLVASKMLGARSAELLSYRTSGDITGDYSAVVGYCSIAISR